jgi:cell division protein FtsN
VHVSSFRKRAIAEADAQRIRAQLELPVRVVEVDLGVRGVWYRVVVGEVESAAEALALRERLKERGIPDGVVQTFRRETGAR